MRSFIIPGAIATGPEQTEEVVISRLPQVLRPQEGPKLARFLVQVKRLRKVGQIFF